MTTDNRTCATCGKFADDNTHKPCLLTDRGADGWNSLSHTHHHPFTPVKDEPTDHIGQHDQCIECYEYESAPVKDEGFDALLPCPFCGETKELEVYAAAVICNACHAHGPIPTGENWEAAWNARRSIPPMDIEGIALEIAEDLRNHDLHDCASEDIAFCAAIPRIAAILRRSLTDEEKS